MTWPNQALERTGLSRWVCPWDFWFAHISSPVAQLERSTTQYTMPIAPNLEERIATLENLVSSISDLQTADIRNEQIDDAKMQSLYTIVQELAEKAGVPIEKFLKHYEIRFRWWHDYYLRRAEDVSPALAAQIDIRTVEQADVSPTYPPLFDEPRQD